MGLDRQRQRQIAKRFNSKQRNSSVRYMKNKQSEVSQDGWRGGKTILHRGFTESIKNILKTIKLTESRDIRKAMAIHWREASDGQEHWLMHWGWLKSDQTCTQANMLAVFPLTTSRDRRWWSHCPSLGSPEMLTSFFARQLKKGAVDLPYTPVISIFYTSCLHIHVNGSVWHSHSSEFYLSTWVKYDSIFVNRWSAPDLRGLKWVL